MVKNSYPCVENKACEFLTEQVLREFEIQEIKTKKLEALMGITVDKQVSSRCWRSRGLLGAQKLLSVGVPKQRLRIKHTLNYEDRSRTLAGGHSLN